MKWMAIFAVLLLLCGTAMASDLCSDSDGGPDNPGNPDAHSLETKGTAKRVVSEYEDTCLAFEDGYSTDEGVWLKEYYCDEDDLKDTQYDCTAQGYTGCKNGACVGNTTGSTTNGTGTTTTPDPSESCGNEILEKDLGEECDPPHSVCFGNDMSEYGQCTTDCKCKLANAVAMKCGNGEIDEGETCEKDSDCEHWEYCKKCICVEKPQEAEDNTTQQATNTTDETEPAQPIATEPAPEEKDEIKEKIEQKYPKKNITPVDIGNVTNFTADPAIQTTSGVAKFFMGIWDWIVGLFS